MSSEIDLPPTHSVPVDPDLWKACAGTRFKVPLLNTCVYYFPEGHAEHCGLTPPVAHPMLHCRVLHVRYLADPDNDEVFAAIRLQPTGRKFTCATGGLTVSDFVRRLPASNNIDASASRIVSEIKVMTQSDANNGGGFSVPKRCAQSIFPPLNYDDDPPVLNLTISDLQGRDWVFRYIYRGKPLRHLFTTGWTKFCNHKQLVSGDTVVFMKDNLTGKLYIGIRRRAVGRAEWNRKRSLQLAACEGTTDAQTQGLVVEATASLAAQGLPFDVIIYPRNGTPDFVVNADLVDMALNLRWTVGMHVKMAVAGDNFSMPQGPSGRVSVVRISQDDRGQWQGSPWKMLQITWDEPQLPENVERLCPWQVVLVPEAAALLPIHPLISLEAHHNYQPLTHGNMGVHFAVRQEPHSTMAQGEPWPGQFTQSYLDLDTHLASMQGARHSSDVSDLTGGDAHALQMPSDETLRRSDISLFRSRITEVTPGSHQLPNFSTESHSSLRSYGPEVGNSLPHGGGKSIQLFGKIIHLHNPVEKKSDDAHCVETDSSKGDDEAESAEKLSHSR